MRRFEADEIRRFLAALDRELEKPTELVLIGGAAAMLAYGVERTTRDIDTWSAVVDDLRDELARARARSGISIPTEHAAVADAPYGIEDRLQVLEIRGLEKLGILVPERHDLVLMKMLRGYEHDLETAEAIHERHGLDFETLLVRYTSEMDHVIGERRKLDLGFLALVERLFEPSRVEEAERRLKAVRAR